MSIDAFAAHARSYLGQPVPAKAVAATPIAQADGFINYAEDGFLDKLKEVKSEWEADFKKLKEAEAKGEAERKRVYAEMAHKYAGDTASVTDLTFQEIEAAAKKHQEEKSARAAQQHENIMSRNKNPNAPEVQPKGKPWRGVAYIGRRTGLSPEEAETSPYSGGGDAAVDYKDPYKDKEYEEAPPRKCTDPNHPERCSEVPTAHQPKRAPWED